MMDPTQAKLQPSWLRVSRLLLDANPPRRLGFLLAALLAVVLTGYIWADNLGAKFGDLDDHQVTYWMGQAKSMSFTAAKQEFLITEAMEPGMHQRYRPVYYFLRIVETYLFGGEAKAWYGLRMGLFALCSFLLTHLAVTRLGLLPGLALGALVWTAAYWASIWAMLGPAETYACVGSCVYLTGLFAYLHPQASSTRRTLSAWAMGLGCLVAAGSKENFTALALVNVLVILTMFVRRQFSWLQLLPLGSTVLGCGFVLWAAWKGTVSSGTDIYEQSVGMSRTNSLQLLFDGPGSFGVILIAALLFVLGVRLLVAVRPADARNLWKSVLPPLVSIALLFVLYASQVVFYNGKWDALTRYALPGELLYWGAWLAGAYAVFNTLHHYSPMLGRVAKVLGTLVLLGFVWHYGYGANRAYAAANQQRTSKLQAAVGRAKNALSKNPKARLILYSATLNDYERIFALKTYLDSQGLEGKTLLQLAEPLNMQDWPKALAERVYADLKNASEGVHYNGFACLRVEQLGEAPCYRLVLTGEPKADRCGALGTVND